MMVFMFDHCNILGLNCLSTLKSTLKKNSSKTYNLFKNDFVQNKNFSGLSSFFPKITKKTVQLLFSFKNFLGHLNKQENSFSRKTLQLKKNFCVSMVSFKNLRYWLVTSKQVGR